MARKSPLREGLEEFLQTHGPSTIEELVEKVGRLHVPAPVAVRERRSHLDKNSVSTKTISPNAEVLVGTRSLVQKMLWSAMKGGSIKRKEKGLYEYVPEHEQVSLYTYANARVTASAEKNGGEPQPYRSPRALTAELQRQLRRKLDEDFPTATGDTWDDQERILTRQALFFADKVASAIVGIDKAQANRRNVRSRAKKKVA